MAVCPIHPGPGALSRRRGGLCLSCRRGMTLVEVLLALSITAMIGLSVSTMLFSVSRGTEMRHDLGRQNVRLQVIGHRLDVSIRSSRAVLASGDGFVVLWRDDARPNHLPDLSELLRIEWDAAARTIRAYMAPDGLPQADDVTYDRDADFAAITAALRDTSRYPGETWSGRVAGWEVEPAGAGPDVRTVRYRLTLEGQDRPVTTVSTVSLRGR